MPGVWLESMNETTEKYRWYALHTRHRHEKKVNQRLLEKGVESYLPLNTHYRKWSDRYKEVKEPLFSCYVFVRIDLRHQLSALQTDGAVGLVSFSGIPAPIPDEQIEALQRIVEGNRHVDYAEYMPPGSRVKVTQGPFQDIEGIMVRTKSENRLIISIDGIRQAISVEIDPRDVTLLERYQEERAESLGN